MHTEMRSKMADLNELNEKVEQIKADIREQLEKIENTKGVYEYKKTILDKNGIIGGLMKQEVREIASWAGLPSARRKDSQGICFLGKINYNDFVRRFLGEREGAIIELETGKKVGTHRGYWFHTIGQRKGLGLSGGPWFVIKKDVEENIIYVSHGYGVETQFGSEFRINDFHFIFCTGSHFLIRSVLCRKIE